jgi:ppGpp synthetase/RelA/SpoT-type nucleotidyltranferase
LQKEIQVRTANQNKHAEWCHDAYKPQTAEQRKVIQENEEDVRSYAIAMGKYMYALDKGEDPGEKPKPTKAVAAAFGTLD